MAELLVHNGANVAGHDGGEALIWAAKKGIEELLARIKFLFLFMQ